MPVIDIGDNFGRQVTAMDGNHGAVGLEPSSVASVPNASWLAAVLAAFYCPSSQIVGQSCRYRKKICVNFI
jgi:hypothetical protein